MGVRRIRKDNMKKLRDIINDLKGNDMAKPKEAEIEEAGSVDEEKAKLRKELRESEAKNQTEKRPTRSSGVETR